MDGIALRQETPADARAIDLVNISAFGGEEEARLVTSLRGSSAHVPELSLVAESNGRVVGHILLFHAKLINEAREETKILALAPLAVMPSQSHRGIGSALVRAAIKKAGSMGYGAVVVVGHPEYYKRFGFQSADKWHIHCPVKTAQDAMTAIELVKGTLSGGGEVSYPPAFTQLFEAA